MSEPLVSVTGDVLKTLGEKLERAIERGDDPPQELAERVMGKVTAKRRELVARALAQACPESLEKLAVEKGAEAGIEVELRFDFIEEEWVIRMRTSRGTVEAAPKLPTPFATMVNSPALPTAWRNALAELGLLS